MNEDLSGVIWITGLPNSGKTTFGDRIAENIRAKQSKSSVNVIRLDGDILRLALKASDISNESTRHDLAESYWQLARLFALQGNIVVVSVVAAFPDVLESVANSAIKTLVVGMMVDFEVLRTRNSRYLDQTNLYGLQQSLEKAMPSDSLQLDNIAIEDFDNQVQHVLEVFHRIKKKTPSILDSKSLLKYLTSSKLAIKEYWDGFYSSHDFQLEPSSFAKSITSRLSPKDRILEIGCGDGRDSVYFSKFFRVLGLDLSRAAIDLASRRSDFSSSNATFEVLADTSELGKFIKNFSPTVIYIRFVLHAMSLEDEQTIWKTLSSELTSGSKIFLEVRTVADSKYDKGLHLSADERYEGHYRRFATPSVLIARIESYGFKVMDEVQGASLSIVGEDNPDLLRLEIRK